jgi:hypothetical protein
MQQQVPAAEPRVWATVVFPLTPGQAIFGGIDGLSFAFALGHL